MAILNLGTVIAVAKETAIGVPVTTFSDSDVVSFSDGSGMTPSSEVLSRTLLNGSYISCPSLSGTQSTSGNLDTEIGVQAVSGTEAGKLKAHLIWEACLGTYVEQGADCSVANTIGIEADPVTNPTGYDLYKLSKPDEPSITLAVREYLGGTNKVLESRGCVVTSLAINLAVGQIASASASVDGVDYAMPIKIEPKPSTVYRIWFVFEEYREQDIITPNINPIERKGFTVIEWGGMIY